MKKEEFAKKNFTYRVEQRCLRFVKAMGPEEGDELLLNEEQGEINEAKTDDALELHLTERIKDIVREVVDEAFGQLSGILEEIKKAKPVTVISKEDLDNKKHTLCYDPTATQDQSGYIVNPVYVYSNFDTEINLNIERGKDEMLK